jgi:hypothetical protein
MAITVSCEYTHLTILSSDTKHTTAFSSNNYYQSHTLYFSNHAVKSIRIELRYQIIRSFSSDLTRYQQR